MAESKVYFVSDRTGHKEIWSMDYDGANQRQITHIATISLSPRISPDNSRLAFSSMGKNGWEILMYSFDLGRMITFPRFGGTNLSPAWSPDGTHLAFSSSRTGDSDIYLVDASGGDLKRITNEKGPDVSPTWNRKTGAQVSFVSGRTGLPQIYTMEADGTNVQRMTDQGYAVSPNWAPNGQFLAFSWMRKYGPGAFQRQRGGDHRRQPQRRRRVRYRYGPDRDRSEGEWRRWRTAERRGPVKPQRQRADLDHAGRWYKSAAVNLYWT